jgi:hypothetical protein
MSNGRDFTRIVEAARVHYENLKTDIANAKDRVEHIRLSALAQEAHNLLTDLRVFEVGLVYTHTSNVEITPGSKTFNEELQETPLDIPDFKSPYNPDL